MLRWSVALPVFAYSCQAYARIVVRARNPAERRSLAAEKPDRPPRAAIVDRNSRRGSRLVGDSRLPGSSHGGSLCMVRTVQRRGRDLVSSQASGSRGKRWRRVTAR